MDGTQHKLSRIRPPRVQITYDVEVGNAIESKELPLVVGVLSDLAGQPETPPLRLKERAFVQIDGENFNDVLSSLAPRLKIVAPNRLQEEGQHISAELRFKSIDDFEPVNVAKQVEPLRRLLEVREKLVDLLAKLDGNEELNNLLQGVLKDGTGLEELKSALAKAERP
jgi:type VI secretion system ImpB/VipA family protein